MSRPSVGSSSTSNLASMAMTRERCSWVTMPFDNSLTLLVRLMAVFARKPSAFARSKRGCTPTTYSSACETRIQQLLRSQAEPLNGRVDPGPFLGEKFLAFALQQQIARAGIDEHAEASPLLDELLVDQLLIGFQNRERIDPILGCDIAHGRQRI